MNKMLIAALAAGTLVAGMVLFLRRQKETEENIARAHRGDLVPGQSRGHFAMG